MRVGRTQRDVTHQCTLCGKEITDVYDLLSCRFCSTAFHTRCIVAHVHHHRYCPVCKNGLSLSDLYYTGDTPVKRSIPQEIRKPRWPKVEVQPSGKREMQVGYTPQYRKEFVVQHGLWGYLSRTMKTFTGNRKGMVGVYMLTAAVLIAVCAPVLILYDPVAYMADDPYVYHPPTWKYPLGTDVFGRDIYSQVVWGFRSALVMAFPSAFLVGVIGTLVGLVSGYCGRVADAVLQRVCMTFLVWPSVPLVALIVFSWGPSQAVPAVILGVASTLWPSTARAVRAEVMSLRTRPFIEYAKVCGASTRWVVSRHILPRVSHISLLYMTLAVASALVLEATFNFLGLTSPAVITWGQMLSFAFHASRARFGLVMPWWTIVSPSLAIAYVVASFYFISAGLRESMSIRQTR